MLRLVSSLPLESGRLCGVPQEHFQLTVVGTVSVAEAEWAAAGRATFLTRAGHVRDLAVPLARVRAGFSLMAYGTGEYISYSLHYFFC